MSVVKNKQESKVGSYAEAAWELKADFDISEYLQNSSMIRELYTKYKTAHAHLIELEKAMTNKIDVELELTLSCKEKTIQLRERSKVIKKLEQENEQLRSSIEGEHQLRTNVTLLEGKLEDGSRASFLQFLVSLLATVLLGFGVNVVTTTPGNWMAWVLIMISTTLSIFAFTFVRKKTK